MQQRSDRRRGIVRVAAMAIVAGMVGACADQSGTPAPVYMMGGPTMGVASASAPVRREARQITVQHGQTLTAIALDHHVKTAAIIAANQAVLAQDQATDQWNFYEAKSLKKNLYAIAADAGGAHAADYAKKAKTEGAGQDQAQVDAKGLEDQREQDLKRSETHEGRHHRLTIGATLLEMAIALSTIAIVTKKRWPWMISGALGGVGAVIAAFAYLI